MISWVCVRSGVASGGMVTMAHQPATHAPAMVANTASLCLTEKSMILSIILSSGGRLGRRIGGLIRKIVPARGSLIGDRVRSRDRAAPWIHDTLGGPFGFFSYRHGRRRLQAAFRVHQKCGRNDYTLSEPDSSANLHLIARVPSSFHFARLEPSFATLHVDPGARPSIHERIGRNSDAGRQTQRYFYVHNHVRPQKEIRIRNFQPHPTRAPGRLRLR